MNHKKLAYLSSGLARSGLSRTEGGFTLTGNRILLFCCILCKSYSDDLVKIVGGYGYTKTIF